MTAIRYFQLSSSTMDPCTLARDMYENASATWLCTGCNDVKPGTGPLDLCIQEDRPDRSALNGVMGTGVGVIRTDLLEALGELGARCLQVGKLETKRGTLLPDFRTFHSDSRIIVRGERNVAFRRCPQCGRELYYAAGRPYLCTDPSSAISYSGFGGLVVTEEIYRMIATSKWPKLVVDPLPVQQPLDGLPSSL